MEDRKKEKIKIEEDKIEINKNLRPVRRKLDSKLAFALSLSKDELINRKEKERKRLDEIAKKFKEIKKGAENEKKERQRREKELYSLLFAPIFHGIHIPDKEKYTRPERPKVPYASVFIQFHGNRMDLENLGVIVRSQAGDIFTAFVPLELIPKLEAMPAVKYIELGRPIFPMLDEAVPAAEIDVLHNNVPPITGVGVIVGVYDSDIDIYHPNFRNNDGQGTDGLGSTRIRYIWDQELVAQAGEATPQGNDPTLPWNYGVEYDQASINAEFNTPVGNPAYQTVRHGGKVAAHGTMVTGIAAGNGRAQGNAGELAGTFVGAAPEADIIFVPWVSGHHVDPVGILPYSDTAFLADGCAYIFTRAAQLGIPCVVNVSEGDEQGPHDGSSLGQQFLDNLLETPGRTIVLAAGNSNSTNSHASGQVLQGATENVTLHYAAGADDDDVIEIWYDGHDRFSVTITSPNGDVIGPVAPGGNLDFLLPSGEHVDVTSVLNDPRNGDNMIQIILTASGANPIITGNWDIALTGDIVINGNFQAWVDRNNISFSDFQAPHHTMGELTLADLASARKCITVGWLDKPIAPNPELIHANSGCGPTRDGRIKPEICAVGSSITAPRSRNMNAAVPGAFYVTGVNGSSLSAPIVAGAAALIFQCQGAGLTWADVKQILVDNADSTGIGIPHNGYGFGRLRMAAACIAPPTDVDVWLRMTVDDLLGNEPFVGDYFWISPDIEILDPAHQPILNPVHGQDNFVRVTVRNRGTQTARNTEIYLYWGDPATNMPFPDAWQSSGIYAPIGAPPNWVDETNKIVVPIIAPDASAAVEFRWLPPAPGANLHGDNHFCLIARAENEADNTNIGAGELWWPLIKNDNNITARNVFVQEVPEDGDGYCSFYAVGSKGKDGLWIETDLPEAEMLIQLPSLAIPFKDMELINKLKCPIPPYPGTPCFPDPFKNKRIRLKEDYIELFTGIQGVKELEIHNGTAKIRASKAKLIRFSEVKMVEHSKMPIRIMVRRVKYKEKIHQVKITQVSDGRRIGGVTFELRKKKR